MKKILLLLAFIGLYTTACAGNGTTGVAFEEKPMADLMAMSVKEDKPIFVDVYATWCGPCQYMSNNVFTEKEVGDYFNATFVNAKFDAEKGEGIEVARKYRVQAYPTFLILDSKGGEIGRVVGGAEGPEFIAKVKAVLNR